MTRTVFPVLLLIALAVPGISYGQEAQPVEKPAAAEQDAGQGTLEAEERLPLEPTPEMEAHRKSSEEVFALTKEIAEKLPVEEQKHFFMLYNNYNLIGTVKMVQGDVTKAIEGCGKENPDMKATLEADFAKWNDAVNPVIKEADANVNNMVLAQDYAKPAQIQKIFKALDKTRELANKQIDKQPVTTKDACEYLQEKMTDTQENFVRLLKSTLVSAPKAMPANAEPAPEEKKAEEKKPEEKTEKKSAGSGTGEKPEKTRIFPDPVSISE